MELKSLEPIQYPFAVEVGERPGPKCLPTPLASQTATPGLKTPMIDFLINFGQT
jgi:hypothetical protein